LPASPAASWFFPRFTGEMPDIFQEINQNIRSKYQLVYHPSNAKQDGTYRKLRVELGRRRGQPLRIQDEKHKPLKYDIIARDGYKARQEVEEQWSYNTSIELVGPRYRRAVQTTYRGLVSRGAVRLIIIAPFQPSRGDKNHSPLVFILQVKPGLCC
jgi:hypothetical protein